MVKVQLHRRFIKKYKELERRDQEAVKRALARFEEFPFDPSLRNHSLKGKRSGLRSISAGFDLRVLFHEVDRDTYLMVDVGTHSALYG